jgi:hypothetical protein
MIAPSIFFEVNAKNVARNILNIYAKFRSSNLRSYAAIQINNTPNSAQKAAIIKISN